MGIKGLRAVIRQRAPGSIHKIKLSDLMGKELVFDASLYMYKWLTAAGGIKNKDGRLINHLQGALFNVNCMRKHGISVHYVFDGKPPDEKANTLASRRERRDEALTPGKTEWSEMRTLLSMMGVQIIDAAGEADPYIAALTMPSNTNTDDSAYACVTDDLDALTFGAQRVITDIDCRAGTATMIVLNDVLEGMGMNQQQFVDFCILLGSDYTTKTLPRIGPARSYALMKKHGTIEKIIKAEAIAGINVPPEFDYVAARAVFLAQPPQTVALMPPGAWDPSLQTWLHSVGLTGKRIDNLFVKK